MADETGSPRKPSEAGKKKLQALSAATNLGMNIELQEQKIEEGDRTPSGGKSPSGPRGVRFDSSAVTIYICLCCNYSTHSHN